MPWGLEVSFVDMTVEGPETRTHANLLRVAIGLEHPDDLIEDLAQALG